MKRRLTTLPHCLGRRIERDTEMKVHGAFMNRNRLGASSGVLRASESTAGSGFRVQGSGFRVQGSGFRV